jgi:hypothetical protein
MNCLVEPTGLFGERAEIGGSVRNRSMHQQLEMTLFSPIASASPEPESASVSAPKLASEPQAGRHVPQRIPHWLERAELFLRVLLRMYIGLAICYAPWSRMFWDQNPLFLQFPTLSIWAANGAVRGLVSGLGLLNLWIAFHDAIRHRDG